MSLRVTPITFAEANAFVARFHRHHKPVPGTKLCIAVSDEVTVHGVALVGRPVSRVLDNGFTLEVNRCCTDGTPNACSMLYGAAWRVAKELGYLRLITYTFASEGGASLRGAGWKCIGERGGGSWSRPSRPRVALNTAQKLLWEAPCGRVCDQLAVPTFQFGVPTGVATINAGCASVTVTRGNNCYCECRTQTPQGYTRNVGSPCTERWVTREP